MQNHCPLRFGTRSKKRFDIKVITKTQIADKKKRNIENLAVIIGQSSMTGIYSRNERERNDTHQESQVIYFIIVIFVISFVFCNWCNSISTKIYLTEKCN